MDRKDFAELVMATQAAHPVWFDLPPDSKADADALDEVERQLGVRLPADFGWFLSEYGGGDFAFIAVYSADKGSDLYVVRNQPRHANAPVVACSDDDAMLFDNEHEACIALFGRVCLELAERGRLAVQSG